MIIRQSETQTTCSMLRATRTDEWAVRVEVGGVNAEGEAVNLTLIMSTNEIDRLNNAMRKVPRGWDQVEA